MAGRAQAVVGGLVMLMAAGSVAATSVRRARLQQELPAAAAAAVSRQVEVMRAVGVPMRVVEVRVRSWEQDEMDASVLAHVKVEGPLDGVWVEVSAWSAVGLPWATRMETGPQAREAGWR